MKKFWHCCAWTAGITTYNILSLLANPLSIQPFAARHPWTTLLFVGVTAAGAQAMPLSSKRLRKSILKASQTGAIRDWRKSIGWHPKKTLGVQLNSLFWRVPQTIFEGFYSTFGVQYRFLLIGRCTDSTWGLSSCVTTANHGTCSHACLAWTRSATTDVPCQASKGSSKLKGLSNDRVGHVSSATIPRIFWSMHPSCSLRVLPVSIFLKK